MKFASIRGRITNPFAAAAPAQRQQRRRPSVTLLVLPFLAMALLIGLIGGLGSPQLSVIAGGAVLSLLVLLLLPLYGMLMCLIVLTFLVQGSVMYFARFQSASWLSFGLAILFFCRVLIDLLMRKKGDNGDTSIRGGGLIIGSAGLFLTIFAISIVFNRTPVSQIISSMKSYLPMFSVLFAMCWFRWSEQQMLSIWRVLVIVTYVQLPVVLYQHFFIMTPRSFDSVVGTFGGMPGQGGNSAMMVLFTVIVMLYGLARWDLGLMSRRSLFALLGTGLALILLGEVKAAVVWLPVGALWILRKRAMRSIATLFVYLVLLSGFVVTVWFVYQSLYWGNTMRSAHSVEAKLEQSGGYFFDPNYLNYRTGEISRGASLALWFRDPVGGVPERLVGYGPNASKPGGFMGAGELAIRYAPLSLNATALAVLLWDVGILGSIAYTFMLCSGVAAALRVTRDPGFAPEIRAIGNTLSAALGLYVTQLIYSRGMIDETTVQLLLMLCLGMTVQLNRYRKRVSETSSRDTAGSKLPKTVFATPARPVY